VHVAGLLATPFGFCDFLCSCPWHSLQVSLRPFDNRMWSALGAVYEKQGSTQNAIACFKRSACEGSKGSQDGGPLWRLSKLYAEAGDKALEAVYAARFVQVINYEPRIPTPYFI
jgi:hypothetical protein